MKLFGITDETKVRIGLPRVKLFGKGYGFYELSKNSKIAIQSYNPNE